VSSRRSGLGRGLAALIPPTGSTAPGAPTDDRQAQRDAGEVAAGGREQERGGPEPDGSAVHAAQSTPAAPDASAAARAHPAPPTGVAATVAEVAVDLLAPNPRQPREIFDEEELAGLATSLQDVGMLQPLVVRPSADGRYELVAGERRLRAARLAGMATVPVLVRHTDDADLLKEAVVENIHRVALNPLEEAAAYQQLLQEFGFTQDELATRLGRSRPSVTNALRLLALPPRAQRRVAAGVLSAGHAKALLAIDDAELLEHLADRVVAEGLSVRATEELVRVKLVDGATPPVRGRRRATPPALLELQDDLSDALLTRVRITMGARKGRLAIDFDSVDELERIVSVIATGLEQPPASAASD
jgi:ParB family transcriptional regulator, chromosome partitioning protein